MANVSASWSDAWFRSVVEFAHRAPGWVQELFHVGTDAGIVVFPVLFLAAGWRARGRGAHDMALALLAPLVTVAVYLASDTIKGIVELMRPCRAMPHLMTLADCPPDGEWSFPSNHASVAAAAAATVILAWPKLAWIAVPTAVFIAFSRVFIGVHTPLDVLAGALLGLVAAPALALLLAGLLTRLVPRLRAHRPRTARGAGASSRPERG